MKIRIALALAALAATTLSACSSAGGSAAVTKPTDPAAVKGSVTMWTYPVITNQSQDTAFWHQQVSAFEAKYPNVKVNVQIFPWANRDTALQTAIAAGKGPDVAYLIPDQIPTYSPDLVPLENLVPASVKSSYLGNVLSSVTMNGHMLGLPVLVSANPLMCDKKAFDAVGDPPYPKTWSDLLALAPKFKAAGIHVTNYYGGDDATLNTSFYPVLWQAGGSVFGSDGRTAAFDSPAGVSALTFLKKLADGGYIDTDQITVTPSSLEQTDLAQNKVACTWQNVPADVESFWGASNIKILPPLRDTASVGYGTVGSLSILRGAKSKPAAALWLSWVSQPSVTKAYDIAAGLYSPEKTTGNLYPNDPVQTAMEATIPDMTVGGLSTQSRQVMSVLTPEIQAALLNKVSPQQALDAAAKAAASQADN